jgi:hypothetical protein
VVFKYKYKIDLADCIFRFASSWGTWTEKIWAMLIKTVSGGGEAQFLNAFCVFLSYFSIIFLEVFLTKLTMNSSLESKGFGLGCPLCPFHGTLLYPRKWPNA